MTDDKCDPLLTNVADYYSEMLVRHGQTAKGADWNGQQSQFLRFEQLCKIINISSPFSLSDLGCGYGALYDFLCERYTEFSYCGIDVSKEMVKAAERRLEGKSRTRIVNGHEPDSLADFSVASGIFNVRLALPDADWRAHIESILDSLNRTSRRGFSFNCLTSYSDSEKMRPHLYYADPRDLFDLCKRKYSQNVALLHDYDLYEFTILVRKIE